MPIVSRPLHRAEDDACRDTHQITSDMDVFAARFHPRVRRDVRKLMAAGERFADLARVFPGAAVAIATTWLPLADRRSAIALVQDGAPLKSVARALSLPLWIRRLPPEAFNGPVPDVPHGELFARRIAARLPASASESAAWLAAVSFGVKACHDDFALWLAEQPLYEEPGEATRLLAILSAYAWFSGQPDSRAGKLIVVPWRPQIAFDTAICAAKSWLNRVRLIVLLGRSPVGDTWLQPGAAMGFTFEPLVDAADLLAEAQGMQNCADQYGERIARDRCRLFSVRRGTTRAATLEIAPHHRETGVLAVSQLKGRHNMPAPLEIWQAAHAWLATQAGLKRIPALAVGDRPLDVTAWRTIMEPYRRARNGAPWLPETLTQAALTTIDADMADLARRGGVTSWLFT